MSVLDRARRMPGRSPVIEFVVLAVIEGPIHLSARTRRNRQFWMFYGIPMGLVGTHLNRLILAVAVRVQRPHQGSSVGSC
jgi:hypothetical protein